MGKAIPAIRYAALYPPNAGEPLSYYDHKREDRGTANYSARFPKRRSAMESTASAFPP
ncbi:hypothetical protein D1872_329790 [compost metagenome]